MREILKGDKESKGSILFVHPNSDFSVQMFCK